MSAAPSKNEWKALGSYLRFPGATKHLQCDQYRVTLQVQLDKLRMVIVVFVDGAMKGEWMKADCDIAQRFLRPVKYCPVRFGKNERKLGKRWVAKMKAQYTATYYMPVWTNFDALRRHLSKNNTAIRIEGEEETHEPVA